jgi:hypothetical protein
MTNEIVLTKNELADSLVGELNQLHLKACELDENIKKEFAEKLEICRQIANLIESARNGLRKTQFEAFVRRLSFTQPVLKSYEVINRRARKSPGVRLQWQDMAAFERARETAALASAKPAARLHAVSNYFADLSRGLAKILVIWSKAQNARPLKNWETLQLETFTQELKPLVDLFAKLRQEIARRG